MSTTDALSALRDAIQTRFSISYVTASNEPTTTLSNAASLVLAPGLTLPKSSPTRLRKPGQTGTDWNVSPQEFYMLEAVFLAWHLRDAATGEYMRAVKEAGVPLASMVAITEKSGVIEWLEGRLLDHPNILALQGSTTPKTPPPSSATLPQRSTTPTQAPTQPTTASPQKRRYIPDVKDQEAVKKMKLNEIELRDRSSVLRGSKMNNFTNVRKLIGERMTLLREAQKPGNVQAAAAKPDSKAASKSARSEIPIIVISSSPTSLITLWNVRKLLEESIFEESTVAKERAASEGNARAEDVVVVYRNKGGEGVETERKLQYFVVDGIEALNKFGADPWERVVCVMTTGQAWQFRPYKWSEPKQLFHNVKGFYVCWMNDPPNPKIKDWNVTELKIDPNRRHVDKSTVAQFWKILDAWMTANKPWMVVA